MARITFESLPTDPLDLEEMARHMPAVEFSDPETVDEDWVLRLDSYRDVALSNGLSPTGWSREMQAAHGTGRASFRSLAVSARDIATRAEAWYLTLREREVG